MGNRVKVIGTRVATLLIVAGVAVMCLDGLASAAKVHVFSNSFGNTKGELTLRSESGIAVSEQTGEVYVADTGHSRVAKFSALGLADGSLATIPTPTFIAVDNSATSPSRGDIYVVGEEDKTITKLSSSGVPVAGWGSEEGGERKGRLTSLNEILGIAVDALGHLWVFNREGASQATVREFDQGSAGFESEHSESIKSFTVHVSGEPRDRTGSSLFTQLGARSAGGLAVDSNELLYLFSESEKGFTGAYVRLGSNGEPVFGGAEGNAVDLAPSNHGIATEVLTDDVYAGHFEGPAGHHELMELNRFNSTGKVVEQFGGKHEGLQAKEAVDNLKDISAVAINAASGTLYVADPESPGIAVYSLEEVLPPSATLEVAEVTQHSAKLVGHINPNASAGRAHEVAWRVVCTPSCPGHAADATPSYVEADGTEHLVEVTLEGLAAGGEYSVRLQAENRGGKAEPEPVEAFATAPDAPSVADEAAGEIHGDAATLNATINPSGAATTYHFEYMTRLAFETGGFGASGTQRTSDGELTEESGPHVPQSQAVSYRISGLEPGTEYVYRAVAANSVGTTNGAQVAFRSQVGSNPLETGCPNQALRTEAGARLPDCRAFELVTPGNKAGSLVESYEAGLQAALNGSSITWFTGATATGVPAAGGAHQDAAFYLSTRAGETWRTQRLLAPESLGTQSAMVGLSSDQSYALVEASTKGAVGLANPALYLIDTANPNQTLTTVVPPQAGQQITKRAFSFAGASEDDSLFFFESRLQLTSNAIGGKSNLYVWDRSTGVLSLVGVLPGAKGEAPAGGSFGGAYAWWRESAAGPEFGGSEQGIYVGAVHAISDSGAKAYFTAGKTGQIYLRSGLTSPKPTTVRVSVANAGVSDPKGEQPAAFQEATPDGSRAFFLSSGKMTQDANTGPSDEGRDLYRFEAGAKPPISDVTPLNGGAGARVQGLLGVSADGRSGFLVAKGVLEAGGIAGDSNIYQFEETSSGYAYRFVATLNASDDRNWSGLSTQPKTSRVSEDGRTLLFMSKAVDGGPEGHCIYVSECAQVYRYSIGEGAPTCLSCNPTGEGQPKFGAELSPESPPLIGPGNTPFEGTISSSGWEIYGTLPRNLSQSGARVFFQTSESLLPEDVNGFNPRATCAGPRQCGDVYEWEALGTGSCRTPNQAGGCLFLISTGESDQSSYFLDASGGEGEKGGESVFILTSSSLVPVDEDGLSDVYDARAGGGLGAQHVGSADHCGSLEACKSPGTTAPPATSPSTPSFQGPGNPKQTRCKRGFVKRHGKCTKKPKRHHKKKHHRSGRHKKRATDKKHSGGAK